jgi:putative ABC transport system permease protein
MAGRPEDTTAAIRAALAQTLPSQTPVPAIRSLEDAFRTITRARRSLAILMATFGLLVALLAGAGVYAVVASFVAHRQREVAVRLALGATRTRIARWLMFRTATRVAANLAIGLPIGALLSTVFESILVGMGSGIPSAYVFVVGVFLTIGFAASMVPTRRASSIAPVVTLRNS